MYVIKKCHLCDEFEGLCRFIILEILEYIVASRLLSRPLPNRDSSGQKLHSPARTQKPLLHLGFLLPLLPATTATCDDALLPATTLGQKLHSRCDDDLRNQRRFVKLWIRAFQAPSNHVLEIDNSRFKSQKLILQRIRICYTPAERDDNFAPEMALSVTDQLMEGVDTTRLQKSTYNLLFYIGKFHLFLVNGFLRLMDINDFNLLKMQFLAKQQMLEY
ncbi:hypothetical protein LXL04_037379 [Taraxacum kok-saghyz]